MNLEKKKVLIDARIFDSHGEAPSYIPFNEVYACI